MSTIADSGTDIVTKTAEMLFYQDRLSRSCWGVHKNLVDTCVRQQKRWK
jgi:hypothetical protein